MPIAFVAFVLIAAVAPLAGQPLDLPSGWSQTTEGEVLVVGPDTLRGGEELRVEMHNPVAAEGSLDAWLRQRMAEARVDASIARRCKIKLRRGREASCNVSAANGDHFYYALRTDAGEYRYMRVLAAPKMLNLARYLLPLRKALNGAQAGDGRAEPSAVSESITVPALPARTEQRPVEAARTAQPPAQPVDLGFVPEVEGIYLHLTYTYGIGGAVYPKYRPYILFPDGELTSDLDYYPRSATDLAAWKRRDPRAWGRWSRVGAQIRVTWNDPSRKAQVWKKWFVARPAERGLRLRGDYQSLGGGGNTALGGDVLVAAWKDFRFQPGGWVATTSGSGGSSGGGETGVGVVASSRRRPVRLRYRLEGYQMVLDQMVLDQGDGAAVRHWFYRYPKDDDGVGIGEGVYRRKE